MVITMAVHDDLAQDVRPGHFGLKTFEGDHPAWRIIFGPLIRKKVHRVSSDQRKSFSTFSKALLEVLDNHKQLWNDARSSAELDKFKQAGQAQEPSTPVRKRARSRSPATPTAKATKNKARRARQKETLQKARDLIKNQGSKSSGEPSKKPARDERVPAKEWQTITSFKYSGPKRCPFFNCSLGCRFGDQCKQKHSCVECGKDHPWHGNHWARSPAQVMEPSPSPVPTIEGSSAQGQINEVPVQLAQGLTPCSSEAPAQFGWGDLSATAHQLRQTGPFFCEIFAGKAGLSEAVQLAGVPILPPVDIETSDQVPCSIDVVDVAQWQKIMDVLWLAVVFFLHCGTPCNTYTSARKHDGGPPPLRSPDAPMGLSNLSSADSDLVFLGNLFLERSCEACRVVFMLGGDFSIENPLLSLLWQTHLVQSLIRETRALSLDLDQCAFGTPWVKPTRLLASTALIDDICVRCPGNHMHKKLKGKVWDPVKQRMVFRTKLAQVYPFALCATLAAQIAALRLDPLHALSSSFALALPAADRKRQLYSGKLWIGHRQQDTAQKALAAGYQLKRGAAKPLLELELEPGQAIQWVLKIPHPFTEVLTLDSQIERNIQAVATNPGQVLHQRAAALDFWRQQARDLLPVSVAAIARLPDVALQRLLLGTNDPANAQLGQVCHVALYAAMLQACDSPDVDLPDFLLHGFPIVGPIAPTKRWPPYNKDQKIIPVENALQRAWELRRKIVTRVANVPVTENLKKIWEATLEDVEEGSCLGPFRSENEVTHHLAQEDWIPTQRFEVVQKNKVRGCDSATTNMINQVTQICEKLQLPSTDSNVAALRKLRSWAPDQSLLGWVLDERKAYRQVAVRPDHRKFSVICLKDPESAKPAFFVMVGHSFGLVSAVYNYNRRSAAVNEFLVKLFKLVAFSFYDDKYGFEPAATAPSARHIAEAVHFWLGARFDQKKLQLAGDPTILGVTYNLKLMQLEIKKDRKTDLIEEIDAILKSGLLDPGSAGKLKGKLMFGASQLWGKVGRAFLRSISERQYCKFPGSSEFYLDDALRESLVQWRKLVGEGPPRSIDMSFSRPADVVIFTDGFTPDPRKPSPLPDRIGAVMFDRRLRKPVQFTAVVPGEIKSNWISRTTQIMPIEMLAPIVALETFKDRVTGADVILLIDSEAVEGALVKGYSSREDLCLLVSVFWDLALKYRVRIFIDRVSTDANPADWPSRDRLELGFEAGWLTTEPCWPSSLWKAV